MEVKESSEKQIIKVKEEKKETKKKRFKSLDKGLIISQIFYWLFVIIVMVYFRNGVFETTDMIKNILLAATIVIAIAIDIMLIIFRQKNVAIHKQFLVYALVLGLFYFIATPFGNGTDEVSHFLRVFKISQKYTNVKLYEDSLFPPAFSKLVDYKNNMYIEYENYIKEFEAFSMNSPEKRDLIDEYWNIKLYAPLQYVPQAIGVTAGRLISDNIVVIGMCGRVTGYIFWLALCTYAIKLMPNKKVFLMILCLLPINIFSAIAISGDTVTNAVCMLFIAMIYRKMYLAEKINKKEKIVLILTACMLALCKIVYLPFVTLVFMLKESNFESKKELRRFCTLLIIASVMVGLAWFVVGSSNLATSNEASKEQLEFILKNPFDFVMVLLETVVVKGEQYIEQMCTGEELICHAKATVFPIVSYVISIALLLSLFTNEDDKKVEINPLRVFWIGLIMFGTSLLIATAIYIQWTSLFEVGKDIVLGIQGRYFIPIMALMIFIVNKSKFETNSRYLVSTVILMQIPVLCQITNVFI